MQYNAEAVRVMDTRMKINAPKKIAVVSGPKTTTYFTDSSTSYSNSSVNHQIVPPANSVIDSRFYMAWEVLLSFTGSDTGSPLLQPYLNDGPRAFPLQQIIQTANLTINGQQVSMNLSDSFSALAHYINLDEERESLSGTPNMLDTYQSYGDWQSWGSARNPLAAFGENPYNVTRGAADFDVPVNENTYAFVRLRVISPVFVCPATWGRLSHQGFAGIQNLQVQFNLNNDLTRVWSHNTGARPNGSTFAVTASLTGVTVNNVQYTPNFAPQFRYCVLTPNMDVAPYNPDFPYAYPCFNLIPYSTAVGNVATHTQFTIKSGVISLSSIPSRFYVYVRQQNADRSVITSDVFARIDNVNVTWNNQTGLLASATTHDLYQMSVKNGLQDSFPAWNQFCGSVACFEMGRDIGLAVDEAPSKGGNYQLQVQVTFTNLNLNTINFSLYVIPVLPQIFILKGNTANVISDLVTAQDIMNARSSQSTLEYLDNGEPFGGSYLGGSFFSKLKSAFGKAADWVGNKAIPWITNKGIPAAMKVAEVAKSFSGHGMDGAGMRRRRSRGGIVLGGCAECGMCGSGDCEGGCDSCPAGVCKPLGKKNLLQRLEEYEN